MSGSFCLFISNSCKGASSVRAEGVLGRGGPAWGWGGSEASAAVCRPGEVRRGSDLAHIALAGSC